MTIEHRRETVSGNPAGDDVLALLQQQVDLYRDLETLANRQRNLISEEDPHPLLRLLADRQKLTDELTATSRRLEPFRTNWPVVRESLTREQRSTADQLLTEAGERLGRIIAADKTDAQLLAARKSRTATAVSKVQPGRRMLTAYAGLPRASGTRLDRMDEQ